MVEKFTLRIRKLLNTYQQNDCWWYLTCRMNKAKTTFAWTRIGQLLWAKSNSTTTCIPKALLKMSTSTWDDYVDCIVRLDEPVRANFHPSSDISAWTFHQSSQIPNILGRIDGRTCPYRFQEIQMQSLYSKSSLFGTTNLPWNLAPNKRDFSFFILRCFFLDIHSPWIHSPLQHHKFLETRHSMVSPAACHSSDGLHQLDT